MSDDRVQDLPPPREGEVRWDLKRRFGDPGVTIASGQAATAAFVQKWKPADGEPASFVQDPAVMAAMLAEYGQLANGPSSIAAAMVGASLAIALDKVDTGAKEACASAESAHAGQSKDLAFVELTIAQIPPEAQAAFLDFPELQPVRHWLERLFENARYNLGEEAEGTLSLLQPVIGAGEKMVENLLQEAVFTYEGDDGPVSGVSLQNALDAVSSPYADSRASAGRAVSAALQAIAVPAAYAYNAYVESVKVEVELRVEDTTRRRPEHPRLIADDIDGDVVDALVSAVTGRYDIPRRHQKLRQRLLGLPSVRYWDKNAAFLLPEETAPLSYSFPEATRIVREVLGSFHAPWGDAVDLMVRERLIDSHDREGKTSGGFCQGYIPSVPPHVLLNHTGRPWSVVTLAHEMGHAINYLSMTNAGVHPLCHGTPLCCAETASTLMQDLVSARMPATGNGELGRLKWILQDLDGLVAAVHRQIAIFRFEQEAHRSKAQRGFLDHEKLGELFVTQMRAYLGDDVLFDEGQENWWLYIGQVFRAFYVYTYGCGLLAGKAMARMLGTNPASVDQVNGFLAAGKRGSPLQLFAQVGIDITDPSFWEQGLQGAADLLYEAEAIVEAHPEICIYRDVPPQRGGQTTLSV